eukprot:CAMPEP_0185190752 /NCGR_PEP_ID=MMETSP1140-20130426/12079_1 /TAXON_ID=298111 /ORGANISM="Pavlova sp., Strain CCMP459" /LENGTH=325 /DNA_ID=CAMNT_0027757421 /DNA_START=244 /DNA_END=1220 /DNA_ORIENTATION=-
MSTKNAAPCGRSSAQVLRVCDASKRLALQGMRRMTAAVHGRGEALEASRALTPRAGRSDQSQGHAHNQAGCDVPSPSMADDDQRAHIPSHPPSPQEPRQRRDVRDTTQTILAALHRGPVTLLSREPREQEKRLSPQPDACASGFGLQGWGSYGWFSSWRATRGDHSPPALTPDAHGRLEAVHGVAAGGRDEVLASLLTAVPEDALPVLGKLARAEARGTGARLVGRAFAVGDAVEDVGDHLAHLICKVLQRTSEGANGGVRAGKRLRGAGAAAAHDMEAVQGLLLAARRVLDGANAAAEATRQTDTKERSMPRDANEGGSLIALP